MPTIRPANVADAARMWAIAQAAYQPYTARIGRPPAPMTADCHAVIAADHGEVFFSKELVDTPRS